MIGFFTGGGLWGLGELRGKGLSDIIKPTMAWGKWARNDIGKGWHQICHCEERSDEAISVVEGMNDGIASLRSQ